MDGYFQPNFKNQRKALRVLELDDCDFIQEDEGISHQIVGYKHTCPRCGEVTHLQIEDPYCPYCNWDSLEDQTNLQME